MRASRPKGALMNLPAVVIQRVEPSDETIRKSRSNTPPSVASARNSLQPGVVVRVQAIPDEISAEGRVTRRSWKLEELSKTLRPDGAARQQISIRGW